MADARKPNICFVSESEATYGLLMNKSCKVMGGAELQQILIASSLRELGYPVTFLVSDFGQAAKTVTDNGIALVKISHKLSEKRRFQNICGSFHLFKNMNQVGADIYYQRTSSGITGVVALYCKFKKKPFVFSVAHNMDLDGASNKTLSGLRRRLYDFGLKNATAVVVQTDDQMRLFRERFGRDGVLIRSTFSAPKKKESSQKKHVLWVGNIKPVKRPQIFLEIAKNLPEYKFVMVGGVGIGCEELASKIQAGAKDIPNLEVTGAVPYDQVGRYFDEAFVFVNTSSDEGFPNTYLQAWCRGVPVVGTFNADSLITKHNLGRHCMTADELAAAVDELMKNESLIASVGENAVQYVKEHHSQEAVAKAYDRLFTKLWQ